MITLLIWFTLINAAIGIPVLAFFVGREVWREYRPKPEPPRRSNLPFVPTSNQEP